MFPLVSIVVTSILVYCFILNVEMNNYDPFTCLADCIVNSMHKLIITIIILELTLELLSRRDAESYIIYNYYWDIILYIHTKH